MKMVLLCHSQEYQKASEIIQQGNIIYNDQERLVTNPTWHENLFIWPKNTKQRLLCYKLISSNGRLISDKISNAPIFFVTLERHITYFNEVEHQLWSWGNSMGRLLSFYLFRQHSILSSFWLSFSLIDLRIMSVIWSNSS